MYHTVWARLPPRRVRAGRNMNKGVTGYVTTRDTGTDGRTGRSYVFPRGQRRIHNFRKESEAVSNIGRYLPPLSYPPTAVRGVFCRVVSRKVKVNSPVFCRAKSECVFVSLGRRLRHMNSQNAPRLRPDGSQSHPSKRVAACVHAVMDRTNSEKVLGTFVAFQCTRQRKSTCLLIGVQGASYRIAPA